MPARGPARPAKNVSPQPGGVIYSRGFMKAPFPAKSARLGFTLVELLVVIVVIAVLMGVLMPQVSKMKERGRRTICASNLRQIHALIETYMKDYDDCFPYYDISATGISTHNAPMLLDERENILIRRRFTRNIKVFQCPSRMVMGDTEKTKKFHYKYNPMLSVRGTSGGKAPRVLKSAQVQNPGLIRLAWDNDDEGKPGTRSGEGYFDVDDNHGADGGNVVYVDGHIQWWTSDKFYEKDKDQVDPDPENR